MRVAAIQMEPVIADVSANLEAAERLADLAGAQGAEWIVLPEFFTTGIAFDERLAEASLAPHGEATELLKRLARRHGARVGGSFLCRDSDGEVRNAFLLAGPDGEILGRHDKDLPTMWENCFYVGGTDDGRIAAPDARVGVALCWELIRRRTARRLRGHVDVVVGGSCWWTIPAWPPRALTQRSERRNATNASRAAPRMARLVGAPVVHAAHCGAIECPLPWTPLAYRGRAEGAASVSDAQGRILAFRDPSEGPGVAIADVAIGAKPPLDRVPEQDWLCRRGAIPALAWHVQRAHGRRWYARHVRGRYASP